MAFEYETSFDWQVVQVTSLVKYSESSVLVKSTFAKVKKKYISLLQLSLVFFIFICWLNVYVAYSFCLITNFLSVYQITKEWCDIDFNDANIALLGVTKITDVSDQSHNSDN